MQIDDRVGIISEMKSDKYKDAIFKFCDLLEHKYEIKSELIAFSFPNYNNDEKTHYVVGLKLIALFNHNAVNSPETCFITKSIKSSSMSNLKDMITYRKLFNRIFMKCNKQLYCEFVLDCSYKTTEYNSFEELMIGVDLGTLALQTRWELPDGKHPKLKLI